MTELAKTLYRLLEKNNRLQWTENDDSILNTMKDKWKKI
ncbi:hypothetical protein H312_03023 [Anncaliia algerae PRA339]|uniref:Uncharacterized protein n=1 Tax=Anncaliia algerae PRA339 TaxID=1288291 RepID=A0A059EX58_9MICR|nr:hypothetical protein H312_03023 [Anncaliia algerae PRA339]